MKKNSHISLQLTKSFDSGS